MSRKTATLAACLLALLLAPPARAQFLPQPQPGFPMMPAPNPKALEALKQALQDLRDAKELAGRVNDPKLRRRLERLIDSAELNVRRLTEGAEFGPNPFFPAPTAMPRDDFDRLIRALKGRKFNTERLQTLALTEGAFFSSAQGKEILRTFSVTPDGQRRAAIWLYPRLVDRPNFNVVLEVIPYPLERQAVLRALGLSTK